MRKDTKVYQRVSGGFGRGDEAVRSRFTRSGWDEGSIPDRSCLGIDKDTHIDKEYTDIDKEAMCICGIFAVLMSGLGASLVAQVVWLIGCDAEAVAVLGFTDVDKDRSSTRAIACASGWSESS